MSGRFFIDTNVFVYSVDGTSPRKASRATELIREGIRTRTGIVSYQVVQEFFNVALRRFRHQISTGDALNYLQMTFRPLLAIQSSQGLYAEALRISDRFQIPWFDSLIVAGAIEAECEILYSEDFQDRQKIGSMTVVNPFL